MSDIFFFCFKYSTISNLAFCDIYPLSRIMKQQL